MLEKETNTELAQTFILGAIIILIILGFIIIIDSEIKNNKEKEKACHKVNGILVNQDICRIGNGFYGIYPANNKPTKFLGTREYMINKYPKT